MKSVAMGRAGVGPALHMTLAEFRAGFDALKTFAWLDTPGCPPASRPVLEALHRNLDSWQEGHFSWTEWEADPDHARADIASLLGATPAEIALVSSVSEAASTVARSLPRGARVLVEAEEFRSNLFPWTALAERGEIEVVSPQPGGTGTLTDRLCASLVDGIDLVAVSTALSSTGARPDLSVIAARARAAGAKLFLDATQSFGVLRLDLESIRPDYVAVHGYKWMLAPRGCAWMYVRSGNVSELEPLAPGWHTVDRPNAGYFGEEPWSAHARKLDGALPWLPWIGGRAAVQWLRRLDAEQVEARALDLAGQARRGLESLGIEVAPSDQPSHIVRMYAGGSDVLARHLRSRGVIASGGPTGLRVGFHGFNDDDDVTRFLDGVETWQSERLSTDDTN
ncbi:aminotransferase class V-fold PLP-dependent enzyme [Georgenia yuyongxinii]|uniref:Aminotransferase class V-fold PLP-dependent enzyme n=1 Tax=Georgenia yuyongxinii TaxID=2589797 RepID=A0A552WY76_9MICO|nr:aminotransferase class V-fold PLP-dependent enzyme [Georgenia yuyongxinii]